MNIKPQEIDKTPIRLQWPGYVFLFASEEHKTGLCQLTWDDLQQELHIHAWDHLGISCDPLGAGICLSCPLMCILRSFIY